MNKAEIATVERLRREGKELSAIAQETGISINTMHPYDGRGWMQSLRQQSGLPLMPG